MGGAATADRERALAAAPTGLLIGGEWRDADGAARLDVEDPASAEVLASVADAGAGDGAAAAAAAVAAQADWARTAPRERGEILRRAFETLVERRRDLALLLTLEMGKPVAEAEAEIAYAAEFFRWFSEEAVRVEGDFRRNDNGRGRTLVARQPVGPVALILPWNFPMAMGTRKIGPAIAAGCTMVVKPAALTPLSTLALARILEEAGLPPGVLNVLTTSSSAAVMEPIILDGAIRKLSFTGSTPVGRHLTELASRQLLRVSMELGGNAPFLVFEDADLESAVDGAMVAKLRNVGQSCTAANRFLVAEPVAAEFAARLAARMERMRLGPGSEAETEVGPLIDSRQRDSVAALVEDARGRGATVLTGGSAPSGPGYFYPPTVLAEVPVDARLVREEIFGPVAPIVSFGSEQEALELANDTEYGLVAYLYTRDLDRSLRVSAELQTGMVGINQGMVSNPSAPFGGIKQSGFGREGGSEGILEYLDTKYIAIASPEEPVPIG